MNINAVIIFCEVDDFVKQHQEEWNQKLSKVQLKKGIGKLRSRARATALK